MTDRIETILRSRKLRVAVAATLIAAGLWAFSPYVTNEVGDEAYVNAPLIRISSPIAGVAAADLPAPGSYIAAARTARLVTARSVDSDALGALLTQQSALAAGLELAERQLAELAGVDRGLALRAGSYKTAEVARLVSGTQAARADARACAAEAREAELQDVRVRALAAKGFAANATVERAQAAVATFHAQCDALDARAAASASEAVAARDGLYLANGSSDTPYLVQQRDRILLRRQELETVVADARARLAEFDARIAAERQKIARATEYAAALPAGSIVWSVGTSPGSSVAPGTSLLDLADCTRRYVEVTLPERDIERLVPGQPVKVRLIGADRWQVGHVVRTRGAAAQRDAAMVAANVADHDAHALTVEVALPAAPASAASRRCDVGRLAEVRFARWQG
jgi:multidrug resistance efflux pump